MKRCSKCKEMKPISAFGRDSRATTGFRCSCRCCDNISSSSWNKSHRKQCAAYRNEYFRYQRARVLISSAKRRARKLRLPFDLGLHREDIQRRIDSGFCELSGIPFRLDGGRTFDSPSVDRIIPKNGYVYSNIRVVCNLMNSALGDWGEEVLYAVVSSWVYKREREGVGAFNDHIAEEEDRRVGVGSL